MTFISSYAFSKTISLGDTSGVQDLKDIAAERAVSSQDMKHHFVGSLVYDLPFGRGKSVGANWNRGLDAVLGGWSVSPIVTVNSGFPLNLTVNGNPSHTTSSRTDRPDIVGDPWKAGPVLANIDPACHSTISGGGRAADRVRSTETWFNPCAFQPNAAGAFGDAGRNILRSPGSFNLDVGAHKSFRVTERTILQLRFESFNATNTPPLGTPAATVGHGNLASITSAGSAREDQIGVKVQF